jgi:hypothetical protein
MAMLRPFGNGWSHAKSRRRQERQKKQDGQDYQDKLRPVRPTVLLLFFEPSRAVA